MTNLEELRSEKATIEEALPVANADEKEIFEEALAEINRQIAELEGQVKSKIVKPRAEPKKIVKERKPKIMREVFKEKYPDLVVGGDEEKLSDEDDPAHNFAFNDDMKALGWNLVSSDHFDGAIGEIHDIVFTCENAKIRVLKDGEDWNIQSTVGNIIHDNLNAIDWHTAKTEAIRMAEEINEKLPGEPEEEVEITLSDVEKATFPLERLLGEGFKIEMLNDGDAEITSPQTYVYRVLQTTPTFVSIMETSTINDRVVKLINEYGSVTELSYLIAQAVNMDVASKAKGANEIHEEPLIEPVIEPVIEPEKPSVYLTDRYPNFKFLEEVLPSKIPSKKELVDIDGATGELRIKPIHVNTKIKPDDEAISIAADEDELRPIMQGIYYDAKNQTKVATDAHVLVVVPAKIKGESRVVNPKTGQVVEGNFPQYPSVIPTNFIVADVDIQDLADKANGVARANRFVQNFRNTSKIGVKIKYDGKEIQLDPSVLLKGLVALLQTGSKNVRVELPEAYDRVVIFRDCDVKCKFALIMPVMSMSRYATILDTKVYYDTDAVKSELSKAERQEVHSITYHKEALKESDSDWNQSHHKEQLAKAIEENNERILVLQGILQSQGVDVVTKPEPTKTEGIRFTIKEVYVGLEGSLEKGYSIKLGNNEIFIKTPDEDTVHIFEEQPGEYTMVNLTSGENFGTYVSSDYKDVYQMVYSINEMLNQLAETHIDEIFARLARMNKEAELESEPEPTKAELEVVLEGAESMVLFLEGEEKSGMEIYIEGLKSLIEIM
jgi:hypothetical protein